MATQLAEEPPQVEAANDEQSAPRDYEAEARLRGWKPLDEFKGDPAKHVDAQTFVQRADEIMPILRNENKSLKREIDDLKKMVRRVTQSEQAAYQNALADLKARQEAAVESGDIEEHRAIDKQIDKLRENIQADTPGLVGGEDPAEQFDAFREANPWYDKANLASASEIEIEARLLADRTAEKFARQGLDNELTPSEFFAKVAEVVEAKFPLLKAKQPRPKPQSAVEGVTPRGTGGKAKTGASLPPEAKMQATRFYNQGIIKAKSLTEALDKYAEKYDWTAQ